MKTKKHDTVAALARARGLNRDKMIRPRSGVFEDKTKYRRSREKQRLLRGWKT